MAHTVDGYDLSYVHRGSWKANRSYRGEVVDQVPVAWRRDYTPGKPPLLKIWFKDVNEAEQRLQTGEPFVAALAIKKPGGASATAIQRLFEVMPTEVVEPDPEMGARSGLLCSILRPCFTAGAVEWW
jgi:hypothetical protein